MLIDIVCINSPNCYHGIEGFWRDVKYKALEVYTAKGIFFALYTEFPRGFWKQSESCSVKTFNKFFKEI